MILPFRPIGLDQEEPLHQSVEPERVRCSCNSHIWFSRTQPWVVDSRVYTPNQQAGDRAVRLSANKEAVTHFSNAISLLKTLPVSPELLKQELALQLPLAVALMLLRGYADNQVGEAFTQASDLCKKIGESPEIARALVGLWAFYATKAEFDQAIELAERILRLALKAEDPSFFLLLGHFTYAFPLILMGNFGQGLEHLDEVTAVYDQKHSSLTFQMGHEFKSSSLSWGVP